MRSLALTIALVWGIPLGTKSVAAQSGLPNRPELVRAQYRQGGSYLGVVLVDITPDRASALGLGEARGAEVKFVEQGSPAEKAGIRQGDVLISYNGENILGAQQLGRLVNETPQGRKIKVQYWRAGKIQSTTAVPAAPPARVSDSSSGPPDFAIANFPGMGIVDIPRMLIVWDNSALGIESEPMEAQLAQYFGVRGGVLVRSVAKGSPAEKAGIRAGDVITSIGARSVSGPHDLISYMRAHQQSTASSVSVEIVREHRPLTKLVPFSE